MSTYIVHDTVIIRGRGPSSLMHVPVSGTTITINHVNASTDILLQRDLVKFEIRPGITIVAPPAVCKLYDGEPCFLRPYTFDEIPKRCSIITAIIFAFKEGAKSVHLTGADMLEGDYSYPDGVLMADHVVQDQLKQYSELPLEITWNTYFKGARLHTWRPHDTR